MCPLRLAHRCQRTNEQRTGGVMRFPLFAELPLEVVQALLQRRALRFKLSHGDALGGELITQCAFGLLGGLLCIAQRLALGIQHLGRGFLAAHAALLLADELTSSARAIAWPRHPTRKEPQPWCYPAACA